MMKTPVMWMIGTVTWLVTSLASINIGLSAFNMAFQTNAMIDYFILFSGIFSLGLMIMSLTCGCSCGMCGMCKKDNNKSGGNQGDSGNMGGNNNQQR